MILVTKTRVRYVLKQSDVTENRARFTVDIDLDTTGLGPWRQDQKKMFFFGLESILESTLKMLPLEPS
jgi:hypothetical protein